MLNPKIEDAFNKQINAELYSSYLYLSMAAYFESLDLKGMANWMRIQSGEEQTHAMRIFDFINDRSGRVALTTVEAPPAQWDSPLEAFEEAYKHEQKITGMINDLMNLVGAERDAIGHDFLEWFAREQVEEEAAVQLIVSQIRLAGDAGLGRYLLDQQLGQRTASAAAAE